MRALAVALALGSLAARAETGWSPQGLPLVSYNSDEGFGYGARVLLIDHGSGVEQPFHYSFMAQFYQTTKGVAAHRLFFDAPAFLGSAYRVDANLEWSIDKFSPWYGLGNQSRYVEAIDTCGDKDALAANPDRCPGNPQFKGARYYRYNRNSLPRLKLNLRRELGGPYKLLAGYRFSLNRISPLYSTGDLGQGSESQLTEDARKGLITGWDGSNPGKGFRLRTSEAIAGLVFDTRDNEPAPTEGMFHEISARAGLQALGGQFDYGGFNATARFYRSLGTRSVVAALRVLADATFGDVPFFLLSTTGGLDGPDGVGGQFSARGLLKNRLQGKVKLLVTPEVRWRFYQGTSIDLETVAALDAGRVWADLGSGEGGGPKLGGAGGVRVAWNKNFVIRLDLGVGISEPYGTGSIYLTFDEMF